MRHIMYMEALKEVHMRHLYAGIIQLPRAW